jgi:zinc protease
VTVLAEHLETGSTLLDEVARQPAFPAREVDRLRRQTLAELLRRRDQPAAVADEVLIRELYAGTVYQHPLIGTEEAVRRFQPEELAAFHRARSTSRRAALVAVGDFTPAAGAQLVERLFGSWHARNEEPAPLVSPPPRAGVSIHIVDRPGAAQTEIRLGHASVPRRHPDRPALAVMNSILGGKFTSRINLNLRERHGYTYGASSRFVDRRGPGPFLISAAVATESTAAALRETLGELGRIRDELVEPSEIADAISYLVGVFPYTLQTDQDLARRLAELAVYDLPSSYYEDHLRAIARVDRSAVQRVAREHLAVERLAIVAVGPASELEPQLAGLGASSVVGERL